MEVKRGNLAITGQQQECVRRRAALSVALASPNADPLDARKVVDSIFDQCYADKVPFHKQL
jgi:inner membrane protease ATP23